MIKGYKYRLYPTEEQKVQLAKTFGSCRFIYNQLLAKKIELYKNESKSISKTDCNNYCNRELKNEYLWLKDVDKFALTNAIYSLDSAYQNFFRRVKQSSSELGFPKFKSKKDRNYSYKTNFTNNNIAVDYDNDKVKLPKLKWIKCKLHREFKGKIISATIRKTVSEKYFISFNVETEHIQLAKNDNKVGIDLGLKDLVITSTGEKLENVRTTEKYEQQLAKLQRQFAKKQKGSRNWNKHRIKIARLNEKIANERKDHLHKISSQLIRENQFVFSEDLNVKGMAKNHNLAKSIHDASWSELTRQMSYKAKWNGRVYLKINRFYPSSQLCHVCGYQNTDVKNLNVRFWICPSCNTEHDRDNNASNNILNEGLRLLNIA